MHGNEFNVRIIKRAYLLWVKLKTVSKFVRKNFQQATVNALRNYTILKTSIGTGINYYYFQGPNNSSRFRVAQLCFGLGKAELYCLRFTAVLSSVRYVVDTVFSSFFFFFSPIFRHKCNEHAAGSFFRAERFIYYHTREGTVLISKTDSQTPTAFFD